MYRLEVNDPPRLYSDDFLRMINERAGGAKALMIHQVFRMGGKYIPRSLKPLVECSPVYPKFHYYWWRAVTITYAVRPNQRSLKWIDAHRNTTFEQAVAADKARASIEGREPKNVVAIYVRRGDKAREMRMSPMSEYIDGIRLLWSLKYLDSPAAPSPRLIFLASESSQVIEEMTDYVEVQQPKSNTSATERYSLYYTNVFDRKGLYAEKSAQERDAGAAHTHHPEEYLNMLLNIHHLIQGDAWVCTIGSNFCRVVDELRATVGGKAGGAFVDLSMEKCGQPPCIYGGYIDMDWR